MLTSDQSRQLTRIEGDAPMGRLMARFWQPLHRAQSLAAGEALQLILLGKAIMLSRQGDDGLHALCEGAERPVTEAGGLIWIYLGDGDPPAFPQFEFTTLSPDHFDVRGAITPANWLQTLEAVLDTAHLGFLHRSSILAAASAATFRNLAALFLDTAPRIEAIETGYGVREAALRRLPDGRFNTRIREFVGPNHALIPSEPDAERQHIITVPITDARTIQFIITYNPFRPITQKEVDTIWFDTLPDADDIMSGAAGIDQLWAQDRQAMRDGHFSGLTHRQSLYEDLAIVESMGPVVDHTQECLTVSDITIVMVRRALLRALTAIETDAPGWRDAHADIDFRRMRSHVASLAEDDDWRALSPFFGTAGAEARVMAADRSAPFSGREEKQKNG